MGRRSHFTVQPGGQQTVQVKGGQAESVRPGRTEVSRALLKTLIFHFRPRLVRERTLRFSLTFGLGGMAVVLLCLLFITGIMLKFVYLPIPERAYESILYLQSSVPFGRLIRNLHHWSANALMMVAFLHFLRVFFTGGFLPPRQLNWVVGLGLLVLVLASNLTGYLLPWDQLAFWAVTICTGMLEYIPGFGSQLQALLLDGGDIGPATLSIFFALHTAVLPACFLLLVPFHFWRIRKAGGLVVPRAPDEDREAVGTVVPSMPNLLLRELVVATVVIAIIMLVSVFFDAPLAAKANPGLSPNPTKAPWYFAGLQEMILHFHPFVAVFAIPVALVLALLSLPFAGFRTDQAGIWFISRSGRRLALTAALIGCLLTSAGILAHASFLDRSTWLPNLPPVIGNGLSPAGLIAGGMLVFYLVVRKRCAAERQEAIQALFVLMLTVFLVLTITSVWFRGREMALVWPWAAAG